MKNAKKTAKKTPKKTINVNSESSERGFPKPTGLLAGFVVRVLTLAHLDWMLALVPHELQPRKLRFNRRFWQSLTAKGGEGFRPFHWRGIADLPTIIGKTIGGGAGRIGSLILAHNGFGDTIAQPDVVRAILSAGMVSVYYRATAKIETIRALISDNDAGKEAWDTSQCYSVYARARADGHSGLGALKLAGGGDRVKLEKLYVVQNHKPEIITAWQDSLVTDNPCPVGPIAQLGQIIRKNISDDKQTSDILGDAGRVLADKLTGGRWATISKPKPESQIALCDLARSFDGDKNTYNVTGLDLSQWFRYAAGYTPGKKGKACPKGKLAKVVRKFADASVTATATAKKKTAMARAATARAAKK